MNQVQQTYQAKLLLSSVYKIIFTERVTKYVPPPVTIDPDAELREELQEILRASGLSENDVQIRSSGARLLVEAKRYNLI